MNPGINRFRRYVLAALSAPCLLLAAEPPKTGPVIGGFGPAYAVPGESFNLVPGTRYRVSWDVATGPEDPAGMNRAIASVARFLNMHAQNGIDPGSLELAVVLHGSGARAALSSEAHQALTGFPNGSEGLIGALAEKGVRFLLCGQTAGHYGYTPEMLLPQVEMAVSAMTAHARLQQEGYTLNPF